MSLEVEQLAAVAPAPELETTAVNPVSESSTPDSADKNVEQKQDEPRFTQAELDALISKRLAREQRKWDREQQTRVADVPAVPTELPSPSRVCSIHTTRGCEVGSTAGDSKARAGDCIVIRRA
jgi:hypothetical protein